MQEAMRRRWRSSTVLNSSLYEMLHVCICLYYVFIRLSIEIQAHLHLRGRCCLLLPPSSRSPFPVLLPHAAIECTHLSSLRASTPTHARICLNNVSRRMRHMSSDCYCSLTLRPRPRPHVMDPYPALLAPTPTLLKLVNESQCLAAPRPPRQPPCSLFVDFGVTCLKSNLV